MKMIKLLILTAVYLALLILIYSIHVNYFYVNVVLYSAIGDSIIAGLIAASILLFTNFFKEFSLIEKAQLILIWLLVGYSLAISIPTVIDRSLSFYILEKIQQRGSGIQQNAFDEIFSKEYMVEHRLSDVRLTEQLVSGSITIEDGCVKLTDRGEWLATISRAFRKNWLPKKRLLMGTYTDVLVDPFAKSTKAHEYVCE